MLSINYVSVMMWIFYIDWQQYWKCYWILNIGANAHGKRTVSTKQPQHKWQTWQSGFQWHRRDLRIEHVLVLVTRLFQCATFLTGRPFFMLRVFVFWNFTFLGCVWGGYATCICFLKLHFFFLGGGGGGGHKALMCLLFGNVYWYTDL